MACQASASHSSTATQMIEEERSIAEAIGNRHVGYAELILAAWRGEEAPAGTRLAAGNQAARLAGADWDRIEALQQFADDRGVTLLELAIGGLAGHPGVSSVIAGATRPEQVAANAAAGAWTPTIDDLIALRQLRPALPTSATYA